MYIYRQLKKFSNFDYAKEDLMAINADEDDHKLYNGQLAENEDSGK